MTALAQRPQKLTVDSFLAFYDTRPDEEQWQLIDGVAILMTPPLLVHQVVASNLQQLLNAIAEKQASSWRAYQRIGIELPGFSYYRPEPDVAVIDRDIPPDRRHVDRFYLVAEVLSSSDEERLMLKRKFYRSHEHNRAILSLGQERMELELERRTTEGWSTELLTGPDAVVDLMDFGVSFQLRELYRNTPVKE